jgi:hypothetical protein
MLECLRAPSVLGVPGFVSPSRLGVLSLINKVRNWELFIASRGEVKDVMRRGMVESCAKAGS